MAQLTRANPAYCFRLFADMRKRDGPRNYTIYTSRANRHSICLGMSFYIMKQAQHCVRRWGLLQSSIKGYRPVRLLPPTGRELAETSRGLSACRNSFVPPGQAQVTLGQAIRAVVPVPPGKKGNGKELHVLSRCVGRGPDRPRALAEAWKFSQIRRKISGSRVRACSRSSTGISLVHIRWVFPVCFRNNWKCPTWRRRVRQPNAHLGRNKHMPQPRPDKCVGSAGLAE
jgi:hypothetical protein